MTADSSLPENGTGIEADDPLALCAAMVRRHDRDRYVTALFAPPEGRAALMALYAFNIEVARAREAVSEPTIGLIRLQWWRDALDGIYAGAPARRHAVVTALAEAIRRHALERALFDRLIDARAFDMEDRPPESLDELVRYAEATSGALSILGLAALGVGTADAQSAARDAGIAWALTGLLRAVPFHAAQRRLYLPRSLLHEEASVRALFAGKPSGNLAEAVAKVATRARQHLDAAHTAHRAVPRSGLAAMLPASLVKSDLNRISRAGFDVFALKPGTPLGRTLRLMAAGLSGRW